ncbi:rhodanese-like domain-containing protein [Lutimonas halocynthiae]|uniref:rhodanese-like domain-containing protein n=1 Tax=Lutimonas halocynthiae TaxID=1446477 RepID=UPI0025B5BA59|nr:rhodanese-like domain-containing protein [Lutimonas halocynthiae]MDN3641915.1 rhodanese-like domain-containing protein [Lutimonas halocynthiae]
MKKIENTIKKVFMPLALLLVFGQLVFGQETKSELPERKQTTLGLYVTSAEAYEMWKANPEKVTILDIRTPEEYLFIGHAAMAWNIPAFDQSYEWDSEKQGFPMTPNPGFVGIIKDKFQADDILLITCRSGDRSAMAVNELAKIGYKQAYTITDGFEGGIVADETSVFVGQRMVNGWKNSGLPYTYQIDPNLMPLIKEK